MAILEGFRVRNFRVLKDVTLGRLWDRGKEALPPITAIIGKNGVGKSTLFDAFGFLVDSLKSDVEVACDERGGFEKIRSQGVTDPIAIDVYYREHRSGQPITYQVAITADKFGRPYVLQERLKQKRKGQKYGQPYSFLMLNNGSGVAWKENREGYQKAAFESTKGKNIEISRTKEKDKFNKFDVKKGDPIDENEDSGIPQSNLDLLEYIDVEKSSETETIKLENPRQLGIATLGAFKQHPRISSFRRFIEGWYLSYFTPDAARRLQVADHQERLSVHGDNLSNVVRFMEREHPRRFRTILERVANKIPGMDQIDTEKTSDGRLLLKSNEKGFQDPFYAEQISDGTLKVFAYLLMLEDPSPPPFLCIEEPENGLYHKLLEILATEFREHATGHKGGSQVFITTHQPYFVNALEPKEVWILEKGEDGFSKIHRASEDPLVNALVEEGLPLGGLWYSDYLDPR